MQRFSIVSIAFNGYERYIDSFKSKHSHLSDDIIIDTTPDVSMGKMRQRSMSLAKHPYIINLDIDDQLVAAPDVFSDFVGLGWLERDELKKYWLPGERRDEFNTIRSNFMVSKEMNDRVNMPDQDFYIYEYIRRLYVDGASFSKTDNYCVIYNRRNDSLSSNPVSEGHKQAINDLRRLEKAVK